MTPVASTSRGRIKGTSRSVRGRTCASALTSRGSRRRSRSTRYSTGCRTSGSIPRATIRTGSAGRSVRRHRFPFSSPRAEEAATTADVWDLDIDVFGDSAVGDVRDPYPEFHRLQRLGPVHVVETFGEPATFVYSYDGVSRVLSDSETFSSVVFEKSLVMVF